MHARPAKEEMLLMMPEAFSPVGRPHYFQDEPLLAEKVRPSLFDRISGAFRSLIELPHRRAVMDELNSLSDRELADIGVSRAELPRVFDLDFANARHAGPSI